MMTGITSTASFSSVYRMPDGVDCSAKPEPAVPETEVGAPEPIVSGSPFSSLPAATLARDVGPQRLEVERNELGQYIARKARPEVSVLAMSGGGGKGNVYPGCLDGLSETGALAFIHTVAGTSAGSIAALLVAVGAKPEQVNQFLTLDFMALINGALDPQSPNGYRTECAHKIVGQFANVFGSVPGLGGILKQVAMLSSNGVPLEYVLEQMARAVLLEHVSAYANSQQALPVSERNAAWTEMQAIQQQLEQGAPMTFGVLAQVHRVIPEVKELECYVVRMEPGRPQLEQCSVSTYPDRSVIKAIMASSALPFVFDQRELDSSFNVATGAQIKFQDGGCYLNTPLDELLARRYGSAWNLPQRMIVEFEYPPQAKRPGFAAQLRDNASLCDTLARDLEIEAGLKQLEAQHEVLFLSLKRPDGTEVGTLDFAIPEEDRAFVQQQAKQATIAFIERRRQTPIQGTYTSELHMLLDFDLVDLQALADADASSGRAPVAPELQRAAKEVLHARQALEPVLDQLTSAIDAQAQSLNVIDPKLAGALILLSRWANQVPERLAYLAQRLNQPDMPALQRWLNGLSSDTDGYAYALNDVEQAALGEYFAREVQDRAFNVERLLEPARTRPDFASRFYARLAFLDDGRAKLQAARGYGELKEILQDLIEHYPARLTLLPRAPLHSHTLDSLREIRVSVENRIQHLSANGLGALSGVPQPVTDLS